MTNTRYITIISALLLLLLTTDAAAQWKQLPIPSIHGKLAIRSDGSIILLTNGTLCYSAANKISWSYQPFPYDLNHHQDYPPKQLLSTADDTLVFIAESGELYLHVWGEHTLRSAGEGLPKKEYWNPGPYLFTSRGKRGELLLCHDEFYVSTNNGSNWELQYSDSSYGGFNPGAIDEANKDNLFLFKTRGATSVHKSSDGGATWRVLTTHSGTIDAPDMLVCPDGQIHAGPYYSKDYGETWSSGWGDKISKLIFNRHDSCVYALNTSYGLYSRRLMEPAFRGTALEKGNGLDMAYDSISGVLCAIINDSLYEYRQGSVTRLTHTLSASGVNALVSYNASGDTLLLATPARTMKSTDAGRTWIRTSMYHAGPDRKVLMVAKRTNTLLYDYQTNGYLFNIIENERPTKKYFRFGTTCKLVYDPFSEDTFYGARNTLWRVTDSSILYADSNAVIEVEHLANSPIRPIHCLAFDPHRQGVMMLVGTDESGAPHVFRSNDLCLHWDELLSIPMHEQPFEVIFDPSVERRILIFVPTGVYISTDDGTSWEFRDPGLGVRKMTGVAVDPDNASHIYISVNSPTRLEAIPQTLEDGGGVWQSTNGGMTWSKLPIEGLYNLNISIIQVFRNPRRVLVGTPCGAYEYLLDSTTSVTPQSAMPTGGLEFEIYPNPGRGVVNVRYRTSTPSAVRVAVYDVLGRVVSVQSVDAASGGSDSLNLDTTALRDGVYIVTLETRIGTASRRMLIAR